MPPQPGTYALIFSAARNGQIAIGKIGTLQLKPGFYIYVGSAFGPGGLKARIRHHNRKTARPHWHIDYLASNLKLKEIWYTCDSVHREHQWATILSCTRGASMPLTGFGSSDCRCKSHLFFRNARPSISTLRRSIYGGIENHARILIEKVGPSRSITAKSAPCGI